MFRETFGRFAHHWKVLLSDHAFKVSLFVGVCFLTSSYVVDYLASVYSDAQKYISVGDLILDNIPTFNLEFSFTWVMYALMVLIFVYPIFFKPEIVPFTLKTFALLIMFRAGFILLTNLGPPVGFFYDNVAVGGNVISDLIFRNDLFFSGHTSYPFLGFLIYKHTRLRWILLAGSILEGITVLLMHVHYSIDVFAAFFITYGTYALSDRIFNKLNLRFRTSIKMYGWNALKRLKKFKKNLKKQYGNC